MCACQTYPLDNFQVYVKSSYWERVRNWERERNSSYEMYVLKGNVLVNTDI